ncbi:DUF5009 domain-containing protein [Paludisphaera mucosa]|uniref:DUF5009 domain-containing protein n=1 Tax=Paludisphaera mucosa TaxID=3030827 RepID=A0ABT6FB10_9BACT|nr:DUF5009 domain-containing protein [Paludisphaera mucosa]MDG3004624.1 DUF5009 domain-containing protein [Paludisphaera mucosa]
MTNPDAPTDATPAPAPPAETPSPEAPPVAAGRVDSVDVLRGLTILLMVFVNDLGHAAPSWLHHIEPPDADGMTVADLVFPWFLFIVGVSIPLAFQSAFARGATTAGQVGHILLRTVSLLFLGVVYEGAGGDRTLGGARWTLLAFVAIMLAWTSPPREPGRKRTTFLVLKGLGAVALIALLAIYRRRPADTSLLFYGPVEGWPWFRSEWWGILGLIGWAYLTVALLTLWLGKRREWLMGALGVLILLHLVMNQGGLFKHVESKAWLAPVGPAVSWLRGVVDWIGSYVGIGEATGSLAAITMAGCLLGSILPRGSDVATPRERTSWTLTFALGLFVAGLVTDGFAGINKIGATPTWCLWTASLAALLWLALYLVVDVAGWRAWSIVARPAGANPILAYFLHPIVTEALSVAGIGGQVMAYKDSANPGIVVAGSLGMALFVCALTGLLARLGLRVKL